MSVDESRGDWSIASEMALKDTLSKAPYMSRKVPKTYPFLAILFSILCMTLCSAVSVDVTFLMPNCFLLRLSSIPRSCCMCHSRGGGGDRVLNGGHKRGWVVSTTFSKTLSTQVLTVMVLRVFSAKQLVLCTN